MLEQTSVIGGKGWAQLGNVEEMGQFLIGLLELAAMTAAIVFHPSTRNGQRKVANHVIAQTLFIYGLIGMVVGFLVIHNGPIIGFVIFGIGGLLRFRSDVDTPADTMRLILVTLIGLCIGLNLPVMALITTLSALAIVQVLGGRPQFWVEVKFDETQASARQSVTRLEDALSSEGFTLVRLRKAKSKHAYSLLFEGVRGATPDTLLHAMLAQEETAGAAIADWHLA